MNVLQHAAVAILAALLMHHAGAADTSSVPAGLKYAVVKVHIADNNWAGAIEELQRLNDPASADWNNLMGYSLRKSRTPDYAAAEKFYDTALGIDPQHRGALEYSGELYLILGNLPKAEERLATLDKVCRLPCSEYVDLKKAVASYKANGNKYLAAP